MTVNSEEMRELMTKVVFSDIREHANPLESKIKIYHNCLLEKDEVICNPMMWSKIVHLLEREKELS